MSGFERGDDRVDRRGPDDRDGGRHAPDWMPEDAAFAERLRAGLHAAAAEIEPDPAGWRQLNARIRRRKAYGWGGGLALAGAAAALVAVVVLPGDGPRVEFAPPDPDGGVATQPATAPEAAPPTPGTADTAPAPAGPVPGGIVYSDGNSVHVADMDGTILSTPVALGASSQTITDLAVRPGGTTETYTMAYRVDGVSEVSEEGCGDISWVHVPGGGAFDSSGPVPLPAAAEEDCLGAPVFASDGSALGWLAETVDGEVQLQAMDWTRDGPVAGSLSTFSLDPALDQAGLSDPVLLDWTLDPSAEESADFPAVGALVIRAAGESGLSTYVMTGERRSDGGFTTAPLVPSVGELVDDTGIGGTIIDADEGWRMVRLPAGEGEDVVGVAAPLRGEAEDGPAPLTMETQLRLGPEARPFMDAVGDAAVIGTGHAMALVEVVPGAVRSLEVRDLPVATTAVLLPAQPPANERPTDPPVTTSSEVTEPPPVGPTATPPPARPTATPTPTPEGDASPSDAAPAPVLQTAAAIRGAALARDYEALSTLIPGDGFTSNFGGTTDHIAYYQQEEANGIDVLGTLADLLGADPVRQSGTDLWVWPAEYLQEGYLGYRVGITDAGTWQFYVAGD